MATQALKRRYGEKVSSTEIRNKLLNLSQAENQTVEALKSDVEYWVNKYIKEEARIKSGSNAEREAIREDLYCTTFMGALAEDIHNEVISRTPVEAGFDELMEAALEVESMFLRYKGPKNQGYRQGKVVHRMMGVRDDVNQEKNESNSEPSHSLNRTSSRRRNSRGSRGRGGTTQQNPMSNPVNPGYFAHPPPPMMAGVRPPPPWMPYQPRPMPTVNPHLQPNFPMMPGGPPYRPMGRGNGNF